MKPAFSYDTDVEGEDRTVLVCMPLAWAPMAEKVPGCKEEKCAKCGQPILVSPGNPSAEEAQRLCCLCVRAEMLTDPQALRDPNVQVFLTGLAEMERQVTKCTKEAD